MWGFVGVFMGVVRGVWVKIASVQNKKKALFTIDIILPSLTFIS